jgi:hypothetical protein
VFNLNNLKKYAKEHRVCIYTMTLAWEIDGILLLSKWSSENATYEETSSTGNTIRNDHCLDDHEATKMHSFQPQLDQTRLISASVN